MIDTNIMAKNNNFKQKPKQSKQFVFSSNVIILNIEHYEVFISVLIYIK